MSKKKKGGEGENIRVVIRCRNLLPYEAERGDKAAVRLDLATNQVIIQHPVGDPDQFAFDAVFNNTFSQRDIFIQEVQPLVDSVLQGYNATVFAYGQSGSGKTFTMTGDLSDPAMFGMMPQVVDYLFSEIKKMTSPTKQFKVKLSYVELYNGDSRDLLAPHQVKLEIKENLSKNFYVKGAAVVDVNTLRECIEHFNSGTDRRRTAQTDLNAHSSRSHSLFMLNVEQHDFEQDPSAPVIITSKINVVDLAGSEKLSKTNATGETMKEGCNINLSLSALATVIDKLVKGEKHIPYRGSPLTMLLKDSLGGNSKTVMFANIGPSNQNTSETISTLRFAERAKQIENKPVKNLDPKDARIQELLDKIAELQKRVGGGGLDEEERLRERIEHLEIENGELKQSMGKDQLGVQEDIRKKDLELQQLSEQLRSKDTELQRTVASMQMADGSRRAELDQMQELKSITSNFIKRVLTEQQIRAVRSNMPPDLEHDDAHGNWDVRAIQYYIEGFLEVFEDWRRNAFTRDDLTREIEKQRADLEAQMVARLNQVEFEKNQLLQLRETESRSRAVNDEASSQIKVELANAREEANQLKLKVERDQEKMKKKIEKMKEEHKTVTDELENQRQEVTNRDREIERLKKLLEDPSRFSAGAGSSPHKGGPGGDDRHRLVTQLEEAQLAKQAVENRMREMHLLLRRKGICVVPGRGGDAPPPPPPPGGEAEALAMDQASGAFMLAATDDTGVDGDLVSQMQSQLRVQHRLQELRHSQQRKLDDLIRKYELLTTGTVTPLMSSGGGGGNVDDATYHRLQSELVSKDQELSTLRDEFEKTTDKLVKKLNKKVAELEESTKTHAEEKAVLQEEVSDLTRHADDLTKFNSQLALEVENLRSQLASSKSNADGDVRLKQNEITHLKKEVDDLKIFIETQKRRMEEAGQVSEELRKLQQQQQRTEASLKEKITALDNSRSMLKWSNQQLEAEKKRIEDLENQLKASEGQYKQMEESWRGQLIENANKLVAINNKRLEEQAGQYQTLLAEEQEKQKALREKLKKAKNLASKSAQRYDEMVLENEVLLTQFEDLKVSSMKLFRDTQRAATEDTSDAIRSMIRGQARGGDGMEGFGARPQSAYRRM